jgi:hypothetical protein
MRPLAAAGILPNNERPFRYTDKKENQIFLIYKEIQSGAVAKSYMRKGFRKCVNISPYMRRTLVIYDFATAPFWIF